MVNFSLCRSSVDFCSMSVYQKLHRGYNCLNLVLLLFINTTPLWFSYSDSNQHYLVGLWSACSSYHCQLLTGGGKRHIGDMSRTRELGGHRCFSPSGRDTKQNRCPKESISLTKSPVESCSALRVALGRGGEQW